MKGWSKLNEEMAIVLVDECADGSHYPLIRDKLLARALFSISEGWSSITETGTYVGATSLWFSRVWVNLPFCTVDIHEDWVRYATAKGVNAMYGDSAVVLDGMVDGLGVRPFFFLDAHWGEFWPLADELKAISRLADSVVLVHDFDDGKEGTLYDPGNNMAGPVGGFLAARQDIKAYRLKGNSVIGVCLLSLPIQNSYWEAIGG